MKRARDDHRLRDGFRELRAHAERPGAVPDFEKMMTRAKAESAAQPPYELVRTDTAGRQRPDGVRRNVARIGGWVSLAAAAAAAGLLFLDPGGSRADAEFERLVSAFATDAGSGAWQSPTSSLLEMPGLDMGAVPSIGGAIWGLGAVGAPDVTEAEGRDS